MSTRLLQVRASLCLRPIKFLAALCVLTVLSIGSASVQAAALDNSPVNAGNGLTFSSSKKDPPAPLAVHGYDVLSYFTDSKPTPGSSTHAAYHDGAIYWFASERNRKKFLANPANFAPQYGGYCAFGVTQQTKFDGDPAQWTIYKGKLYLNVTPQVQAAFKKDLAGNIAAADELWPEIKDQNPGALYQVWVARKK